jgi:hypothetical protein
MRVLAPFLRLACAVVAALGCADGERGGTPSNDTRFIYVLTGDSKVYRSDDGGDAWELLVTGE